jgi:dipeptide/tripeptide permease
MAGGNPTSNTPALETDETPFERRVGHHPGLFALFFAEMWERFSYYGMRALLLFYMTKDFLNYGDERGYEVYGAYTALVYMTPFIGGMVADKLIGQRAAVIVGGSLMAAGHLVMTQRNETLFFIALALLIVGNGFFKPNIGTILGSLYSNERLKAKRDGGFTIFYMGVNLGAAMAPLLCGYIGETYGWHYGFGLATIGMMIGLAIFVAPTVVTQSMIGVGAVATAATLIWAGTQQTVWVLGVNVFVAVALLVAMVFALWALSNGALPAEAGAFKHDQTVLKRNIGLVLGATALFVPLFAFLVWASSVAGAVLSLVGFIALGYVLFEAFRISGAPSLRTAIVYGLIGVWIVVAVVVPLIAPTFVNPLQTMTLISAGSVTLSAWNTIILVLFIALMVELGLSMRVKSVDRDRLFVILVMAFFSMLFWAFFEQAGSSINNFTDRNIDRVSEARHITADEVGQTLDLAVNQEQLGYVADHGVFTREEFDTLTARAASQEHEALPEVVHSTATRLFWRLDESLVGQTIEVWANPAEAPTPVVLTANATGNVVVGATVPLHITENLIGHTHTELFTLTVLDAARAEAQKLNESEVHQSWRITADHVGMGVEGAEVPASVFQAANPVYILIFGLVFTALWTWLAQKNREPSTPTKFVFALIQLGLGFAALYIGAMNADARGMVGMSWLLIAYLVHTTGELCLSPVGLSMVSKLSPARMVATMMGAWYLATAFSQYLASIIAALTGVHEGGGEEAMTLPIPLESLHLYDDVFLKIAVASIVAAVLLAVLTPLVKKWMHSEAA